MRKTSRSFRRKLDTAALPMPRAAAGKYQMTRLARPKTPWLTTPVVAAEALNRSSRRSRLRGPRAAVHLSR